MRFPRIVSSYRWTSAIRLVTYAIVYAIAWIAVAGSAGLVVLAGLRSSCVVLAGLAAGAAVRWAGQYQHLASLRRSRRPAKLARFVVENDRIQCVIDENRLQHYMSAREWRFAAAVTGGLLCWLMLRHGWFGRDLIPGFDVNFDRVDWLATRLSPVLPPLIALLFSGAVWPGHRWEPQKRWVQQARSVIRARVAKANIAMDRQELDGLAGGVEILWQALGVGRGTDYRECARLALQQNTETAVLHPETLCRTFDVCIEIARQDFDHLREVAAEYRAAEQKLSIARTLSPLVRTHDLQLLTKELETSFEGLSLFAEERRWQDLRRMTADLSGKLTELCFDLRSEVQLQSTGVQTGVLAPGTDPYRVLGISRDTPTSVIRKLRLSLAQIYHPDISAATRSSNKMAEVNAAYDAVLRDRE
jgi:hypothetical protein